MEDFRAIGRRVSNWGRWGAEDERGTLNLITADRLVAAARLVRTGKAFDLGIPFDRHGPQTGAGRINPVRLMAETGAEPLFPGAFRFSDDYVFMPLQAASQWDALAHVHYDGELYNGYPAAEITVRGARRNSIDKIGPGVAGRGVLLDVARWRGVEWLERGDVITPDDLEQTVASQGVEVGPGDILLLRTGWRKKFLTDRSASQFSEGEPGIGMAATIWLRERDIAVLCSDNWGVEVFPGEYESEVLTVHLVLIRDMGMTLGEILDFEALASDCAEDGVYDFFFCGPPLKFTGAVGSPVNPIAFK